MLKSPVDHTLFVGFSDPDQRISSVRIDYGQSPQTESIDDFTFAPNKLAPTRTPLPTWTPIPTAKPTAGPTPTPTPVVPVMSYIYPSVQIPLGLLSVDYSIHGIEITEGIQCFNPSLGLTSCADNSVPLVTKKDAAARIYLKVGSGSVNNVPVRLYLRANNVWYQADFNGKATTAINQGATESANVYFNVNFGSTVAVDFYAVVDPNNLLAESNEGNNRFPAVGYITLNFTPRQVIEYRRRPAALPPIRLQRYAVCRRLGGKWRCGGLVRTGAPHPQQRGELYGAQRIPGLYPVTRQRG